MAGYTLVCPRCNRRSGARRCAEETRMSPLPDALRAHILDVVLAWAAPRYGARMTAAPPMRVAACQDRQHHHGEHHGEKVSLGNGDVRYTIAQQ